MRAAFDLMNKGGKWLGACRSWLQWNTHNGDRVTWGSYDVIEPHLTVKDVEEMASCVAEAAGLQQAENNKRIEELRHKLFMCQAELSAVKARLATHGETWKAWEEK